MTHTVSLTVTAEGAEDVAKLLEALKIAGLAEGNRPKPRENLTKKETPGLTATMSEGARMVAKKLSKVKPVKQAKASKKRKTWLTNPVKSHLRVLASEGKTVRDAEVITGVPYSTIYQWARGNSVVFDKSKQGRPRKANS